MTISDSLEPAFQALQGFHSFVPEGDRINRQLDELYKQSKLERRGFSREGYASVRLIDTFFGSFPKALFRDMVKDLQDNPGRFQLEILAVNPHSQLARSRAQALAESNTNESPDPFFKSSLWINKFLEEVCNLTDYELPSPPRADANAPILEFRDLLEKFREVTVDLPIHIRFYDRPTEAPVYIISEFVAKGLLLDNRGADRNPWMILVNDPNQPDDLYDRLSANFDAIWESAATAPTGYRVAVNADVRHEAFIIMPMEADDDHLESVFAAIKRAWESCGVEAKRADDHHAVDRRITDVMMNALVNSDYVVCDLSRDRPNVYYEAGYAQALGKPVLFIAEEGTDVHFDLRDYPITFYNDAAHLEAELQARIEKLLTERTLWIGD